MNERCRYGRYCHQNVRGYENEEDCPYYWKLDEIAMDVQRDKEYEHHDEPEEEEEDDE